MGAKNHNQKLSQSIIWHVKYSTKTQRHEEKKSVTHTQEKELSTETVSTVPKCCI